jgi:ABC-type antimicrobial peptide transport system permease subunit
VALDQMVELQMFPLRAASWIGSVLGAVALLLSVSGLYGVLTYTWSQRTREIGIRMALGATAGALVRLVMTHATRLAGIGAALGLIVAFSVLKLLSSVVRMSNLSLVDAGAFAAGIVLVVAATALATFAPARRATRVNPAETLRADA